MRANLTPAFVAKAVCPEGADKIIFWDERMSSFGLRVTAGGHKSYVIQYRHKRRHRQMTINGLLSLEQARKRARVLLGQVAHDRDPLGEMRRERDADKNTFRAIADEFFRREGRSLRSADAWRALLERCVHPVIGSRQIAELRRTEIIRLLDKIDDERGPCASDTALSVVRRILNWAAARSDEFRSPIVRDMRRTKPRERARARILNDDELRRVWIAATEMSDEPFGALVRFLLLTAGRRNECARMERPELDGNGTWVLPAARNKTKQELVRPLSGAAQSVLASLPRVHNSPYVFTNTGRTPIGNFDKPKHRLDAQCGVSDWTLHDLRRTARSLMSRAGVNADVAERCLGHVIGGVRGVYDRHEYRHEMLHAYERLAALIENIAHPQKNILPMVSHM
jgi:hypothetical protein